MWLLLGRALPAARRGTISRRSRTAAPPRGWRQSTHTTLIWRHPQRPRLLLRPRSAFITQHYAALKGANPSLPILIRECAGAAPQLTARFGKGREEVVSLAGLGADGVGQSLEALVKRAA